MTAIPYPAPELTDGAVLLRAWRQADLPAAHAATQDELIGRFTYVPERQSEEDLRELRLARLALLTDVDNAASQRVAERAGFTREGILRAHEERKGKRHDVVAYSLVPADVA
jgi:RimJ/RimL family protein N-acetyltransferase